jgi:hypothetical protein
VYCRICSFAGCSSHPIRKFRNLNWYIKWLCKIDRPAWCSDLRIPLLSHFCGNPPSPVWNVIGDEYGGDLITCLPACVGKSVKRYLKAWIFSFDFFSNCSEKQSSSRFAWVELSLAFLNKCSRKTSLITIVYHLSSPLISIEESHHFVNPKVKVNRQVCNDFARIFFSFEFCNENSLFKSRYSCKYDLFMFSFRSFYTYFSYFIIISLKCLFWTYS